MLPPFAHYFDYLDTLLATFLDSPGAGQGRKKSAHITSFRNICLFHSGTRLADKVMEDDGR